jgi:hypothetical protein
MPISSAIPHSDIALEGELLSSLVHPNIIKLRGISSGAAAGFEKGPRCVLPSYPFGSTLCADFVVVHKNLFLDVLLLMRSGYFLIIDCLFEILDRRIKRWHSTTRPKDHGMMRLFSSFTKQSNTNDRVDYTIVLDEQLDVG